MKVKDLIFKLSEIDEDREVVFANSEVIEGEEETEEIYIMYEIFEVTIDQKDDKVYLSTLPLD